MSPMAQALLGTHLTPEHLTSSWLLHSTSLVPPAPAHHAFCGWPSWGLCPASITSLSPTVPPLSALGRGEPLRDGTILPPSLSQLDQSWTYGTGQTNSAWIWAERPWPVSVGEDRALWLQPQATLWAAEGGPRAGMREEKGPGVFLPTAQLPPPWDLPSLSLFVHVLSSWFIT